MAKALRTSRDYREHIDIDTFLTELRQGFRRMQCDTLDENGKPQRSPDRSRCHRRDWDEAWRARDFKRTAKIIACPQEILKGLPCENWKKCDDPHTAWAVNTSLRMAVALYRWADEEMTEEVYHYYVYAPTPCSQRVQRIAGERPGKASSTMEELLRHWLVDNPELSKELKSQYDMLRKAAEEEDRHYDRLRVLPYWNEKDFNPARVKKRAEVLGDILNQVASRVGSRLDAEQKLTGPAKGSGTVGKRGKGKITLDEANVAVRRLLKETPSWDWTVKKLAKKVGCSTGTVSHCRAWKVYNERREQLRKERTIKTVSITEKMESVLGMGEKDEVVQQLIAEQEGDEREDARRAKLYPSHEKKPKRREL